MNLYGAQDDIDKIDANKADFLVMLNRVVNWELFRPLLIKLRKNAAATSPHGGAKGYDVVLIFKMMILQSLYGLSDDKVENEVLDRYTFKRFIGIEAGDKVPDAKTLWYYRELMKTHKIYDELFALFDSHLLAKGYVSRKGQIVDATMVEAPRQRNTRAENDAIKNGATAADFPQWSPNKRRQKDIEARWTQKNGENFYGYKNHIQVDVKDKFIRNYYITDAAVHDSQVFIELLDVNNNDKRVYADSAYMSAKHLAQLADLGFTEHLLRKATRNQALAAEVKLVNRENSRVRGRVEHVFGIQYQRMRETIIRTIGIARARCKLGLRNLAYNISRFAYLENRARDCFQRC